jgi:hypothetical protein
MISDLTNEELKVKLEELEISLPKFNRKKAIELITEKSKDSVASKEDEEEGKELEEEEVEKKEEEIKAPAPRVNHTGISENRVKAGSKAEIMREKLSAQPKVMVYIPLGIGEKPGVTIPVTLNGYRVNIMKGVYVEVPKQIADVIKDSQMQTNKAMFENKVNLDNKDKIPEALA